MPYNTVTIKGHSVRKEAVAGGVITPGHLLQFQSDAVDTVEAHATAGGNASASFAVEYELTGKGITDNYAADDNVLYGVFSAGAEVYALVAAGTAAIAKGAYLQSNGDGTLATVSGTNHAVAMAMEAVDNSGGGTAVRILVEIV